MMQRKTDSAEKTLEMRNDLDARRRRALMTGSMRHGREILGSHVNPDGSGVVVVREADFGEPRIVAHFYRPKQVRLAVAREELRSNDELARLPGRVHELIAADDARRAAPHDLEPGDVILNQWGATMCTPHYYQVVSVPHPRKVRVIELAVRLVDGTWQCGLIEPLMPPRPADGAKEVEVRVSMASGTAQLELGSLSRASRWDGRPAPSWTD